MPKTPLKRIAPRSPTRRDLSEANSAAAMDMVRSNNTRTVDKWSEFHFEQCKGRRLLRTWQWTLVAIVGIFPFGSLIDD